jgi:hypothetical protein
VDAEQRDALADFVRVALRSELNELARLCARVERVERELGAVAVRAGLGSPRRVGRDEEVRRLYEAVAFSIVKVDNPRRWQKRSASRRRPRSHSSSPRTPSAASIRSASAHPSRPAHRSSTSR